MALPLALGTCLIVLFVFLLWERAGQAHRPPEAPASRARATASPVPGIPWTSPTMPADMPQKPPAGEGLRRWSLERLPEGWDPAVAERLARFFEAMDIVGPEDAEKLKKLDDVREELRAFLASLGPEAIPTLQAILNVETDFIARRFIIYALGDLGPRTEEATYALVEFYEKTRAEPGALSQTNHVIEAMGHLKNDASFQALNGFIDSAETSGNDRDKLIKALGEHPRREESLGRFIHHMLDDEDVNVRNHSAQALGKIRKSSAVGDLVAAFKRETQWMVRQTILGSIGKTGDPAALPFLEEVARTAEPGGVRLSAARAIWLIGTPRARSLLPSLAEGEREQPIRDSIRGWLEGR